ncbi:MAG TPA: indole-3-glycerol phosphate synthase TrpC [Deltaproteobacteria bacterium]|nr:indole-3-glycerol phosphate synthase TrpC [Deltaproteobacteria bacterium]
MNILEKIYEYKKEELAHFKRTLRPEDLKAKIRDLDRKPLDFAQALREPPADFAVIAEMKQRSPSKGLLREVFEPETIARDYVAARAAALSVLTDEHFFGGHLDHLRRVRRIAAIPLLRKDFIWDPYQIHAAFEAGADAILLIVAMLPKNQLEDLQGIARELGLGVLVEVHDAAECEIAGAIDASLVGVNNRDLKSFRVDTAVTEALLPRLPVQALKISESGLDSKATLTRLKNLGVNAFLIGEALMKAKNPGTALEKFW